MFPREHGAYGQLVFPLATALALGHPGRGALLLSAAAVCAFLAHEPLLVLLGQRGVRAAREQRAQAWRWFAWSASAAALCGTGALVAMSPVARVALVVPGALALVLGAVILSRREHSMFGEVLSALTLSSLAAPVALASGTSTAVAVTCALVFASALVAGTISVRAVIRRTRQPPAIGSRAWAAIVSLGFVAALAALSLNGLVAPAAPLAALPMCGLACALVAFPPSARHLRVVGWTLVTGTTATAAVLIALVR